MTRWDATIKDGARVRFAKKRRDGTFVVGEGSLDCIWNADGPTANVCMDDGSIAHVIPSRGDVIMEIGE